MQLPLRIRQGENVCDAKIPPFVLIVQYTSQKGGSYNALQGHERRFFSDE